MASVWNVPGNFLTINAALASVLVQDYDTIRVGPGVYTNASEGGPIIITKMIQLLGAQAGVDARTRPAAAGTESIIEIVDGTGSIQVNRENVVVDGFTVRNNPIGVGINTSVSFSGYWIFNNIIENNAGGMFFNSDTAAPDTTYSQVKFNYFIANNQLGGGSGGNGIYSQFGARNMYIDSNRFTGHTPAASINFAGGTDGSPAPPQRDIVISNNEMVNDNSITLAFTSNVKITGNSLINTQGSAIFIAGGTELTEIEGNIVANSTGNGISVNTVFSFGALNTTIRAKDNSIQNNAGAGLVVDSGAYNPVPRRLDATNNWWGNATGPTNPVKNPGGTGDEVVDPDDVTEIVPFLTANPLPFLPGTVVIEPVGRQASTQTTTYVAATKAGAVNSALAGAGTLAQAIGNVGQVWPELRDYEAPNNATLSGNPQIIWEDSTMAPGELRYFSQAFQVSSTTDHVVFAAVFADDAHKLYIEEYNLAGTLIQSVTPAGGLNDGSMSADTSLTMDPSPPYNFQNVWLYSKVFAPVQAGNFIVVTVEAINYLGEYFNPAGVSFAADFYRTNS